MEMSGDSGSLLASDVIHHKQLLFFFCLSPFSPFSGCSNLELTGPSYSRRMSSLNSGLTVSNGDRFSYEGGESTAEGKRRPRAREISKRLGSNALPYPPGGGCADWQKATAEGGRRSGGRQGGEGERKEGWGSEKGKKKKVVESV